jgi:acyl carrier protein phosphodiesterase
MTSDFVKGKQQFDYPADIRRGIMLHRMIDSFTDEHPATAAAKEPFRAAYRLYSGAIIDVIYDHFLANDEREFPGNTLADFATQTYTVLNAHQEVLPLNFRTMLPYMEKHDWLYNYRTLEGIGKSLEGLVRRAAYLTESNTAMKLLEQHYQLLGDCYRQFWSDMKPYALEQFELLKS